MSQNSYEVNMDIAFEGMLADSLGAKDAHSKSVEGAGLEFGLGCALGTNDDQVKQLAAITDKFAGVLIHRHKEEGTLSDKESVSVLRKGRIYVKVETAVVQGDAAHVRAIAPGVEVIGAFRNSADGVNTIDLSGLATFKTSAAAGELAVLDINLP